MTNDERAHRMELRLQKLESRITYGGAAILAIAAVFGLTGIKTITDVKGKLANARDEIMNEELVKTTERLSSEVTGFHESAAEDAAVASSDFRPKTEPGLKRPPPSSQHPSPHPAKKRQPHLPGGAAGGEPVPGTSKASAIDVVDIDDMEDATPTVKSEPSGAGALPQPGVDDGGYPAGDGAGGAEGGEEEYDDGAYYEGGDMAGYGEEEGAMAGAGPGGDGAKGRITFLYHTYLSWLSCPIS